MFKKVIALLLMCTLFLSACNKKGDVTKTPDSSAPIVSQDNSSIDTKEPDDIENPNDLSDVDLSDDVNNNNQEETLGNINFDFGSDDLDLNFDFVETAKTDDSLAGPDIRPTGNTSIIMNPLSGGADAEAAKLRNAITENSNNIKPTDSKFTFYISEKNGNDNNFGNSPSQAWKTVDALMLNMYKISSGATILFERGGLYRVTNSITLKSGVTYGSYGTGEKPVLYASQKNYANELLWSPSAKKYVWMCDINKFVDIGNIVINHGENVGLKMAKLPNLTKNYQFYSDENNGKLYMYLDKGNPGKLFKDIELCAKVHIFSGRGTTINVVIDNLCLKYSGAHGISFSGNAKNITITNCEIGWIGGSYINTAGGRYGNGVEFYYGAENILVENNWVYQVYDAGISNQGTTGTQNNITFNKNLIEYCTWSIEVWNDKFDDLYYTNNIMRFAGNGWGNQRPNKEYDSHFCCWRNYFEGLTNMQITGNIFDCGAIGLIYWNSGKPQEGLTLANNTYYQKASGAHIAAWIDGYRDADSQSSFEAVIKSMDSAPAKIKWLG